MRTPYYLMLWVNIGLNLGDMLTTIVGITYHGGTELNPFIAFMMNTFGIVPGVTLSKIVSIGILLLALQMIPKMDRYNYGFKLLTILNLWYTGILINNLTVILA